MKLDKLVKLTKAHAEQMYQIVKNKHQTDYEKWLRKQGKK